MSKDDNWIYYVKIYFDILFTINKDYIKLITLNENETNFERQKLYLNIINNIPRIIPYSIKYSEKKSLILRTDRLSGILELTSNKLKFVKTDYDKLIDIYNLELYYIKGIRNMTEHSPHSISLSSFKISPGYSSIVLNYKKREVKHIDNFSDVDCYYCDTQILLNLIKELNNIFSKIQKEVIKIINEYKDTNLSNVFLKQYLSVDFKDYNSFYENNVLKNNYKIISKIIED